MSKALARRSDGGVSRSELADPSELQLTDLQHETEESLLARGAAYTREYNRITGHSTTLLKNVATVIIALRIQHDDMRGSTHEYRQVVAGMYRKAGIEPDSVSAIQKAVRWHINNLLRRYMTPRELEAHDLKPTSALERSQDSRARNSALIAGLRAAESATTSTPRSADDEQPENAGAPVKATADHIRLATAAGSILHQLDEDVIKSYMTAGQRAKLDEELAAIQQRISKLRRLTRAKG